MDLKEAKKISSTLEGSYYSAPPRGIDDIIAFVDTVATEQKAESGDLELVNAEPPDTDDAKTLTRFFSDQAKAAGNLGRIDVMLPALRKAAEHVKGARGFFGASAQQESAILYNLAVTEWLTGNFDRGISAMEQSLELVEGEASWKSRSMTVARFSELGRIHAILGNLDTATSYIDSARPLTNQMAANVSTRKTLFWKQAWYPHRPAPAEASLLEAKGKLKEAESLRKAKIRDYLAFAEGRKRIGLSLEQIFLAENLRRQGRFAEAESNVRQAILSRKSVDGAPTSRLGYYGLALRQLIAIYNELGRHEDAEKLSKATIAMYERAGVPKESLLLASAYENLAISRFMQGDWAGAFDIYKKIQSNAANSPEAFSKISQTNVDYRTVLIMNGLFNKAIDDLTKMTKRFSEVFGNDHPLTMELVGLTGLAHFRSGDISRAMAFFNRAFPVLLGDVSAQASGESGRAVRDLRRRLILDGYLAALTISGALDSIEKSFIATQLIDTGSVRKAVELNAARDRIDDPELADLLRREQDLSWQIQSLQGAVIKVLKDQANTEALNKLRTRLNELRLAQEALERELSEKLPPKLSQFQLEPLSIAEVQGSLEANSSLVTIYSNNDRSYVWAIPASGLPQFQTVDLPSGDINDLVGRLRGSLAPNISTLGDIPAFDVNAAYDLYRQLLAPVEKGWKKAKSLIVVTRGSLATLPLSVLPTHATELKPEKGLLFARYRDVPWLARSHAVTTLPSIATLNALKGTQSPKGDRRPFVGFADPFFNVAQSVSARQQTAIDAQVASRGFSLRNAPRTRSSNDADIEHLPRLPDTRREVLAVASALKADPAIDVYLGERASETRVKGMDLLPYKVILFATHGLVSGDLNGLDQPALALSSPKVTGENDDGLLTMGEIMGLKLNADWVVLSACNTAAADGQGAEAVSGLGRAFFYAGARALLVSNWPVHSEATTTLMIDLFRRQAANDSLTRAEALRQTRVQLIDREGYQFVGKMAFSYAHPIFWAPFTIVGDGGGARPAIN